MTVLLSKCRIQCDRKEVKRMQDVYVNVNKLKGKIIENGETVETLAEKIGVDRATLYRKMSNNGKTMLIKDANNIVAALKLTTDEAIAIFFSHTVA